MTTHMIDAKVIPPMEFSIRILGEPYTVIFVKREDDEFLKQNEEYDGYTDRSENLIIINVPELSVNSLNNISFYQLQCLRHEIVHAFLHNSGLNDNTSRIQAWATNEEMVDWIAIQLPKITKTYEDAVRKIKRRIK